MPASEARDLHAIKRGLICAAPFLLPLIFCGDKKLGGALVVVGVPVGLIVGAIWGWWGCPKEPPPSEPPGQSTQS